MIESNDVKFCVNFIEPIEPNEILLKYNVPEEHHYVLTELINNINYLFCKKENCDSSLLKQTLIFELVFYYVYVLKAKDLIDSFPMKTPTVLFGKYKNDKFESYECLAKRIESNSIYKTFYKLNKELKNLLFENIDEPIEMEVSEIIKSNFIDSFDYVYYNDKVMIEKDLHKYNSNAVLLEKHFKITENSLIPMDEILLRKKKSPFQTSIAFLPYIIPYTSICNIKDWYTFDIKEKFCARFDVFIDKDEINDQYKRIKVIL